MIRFSFGNWHAIVGMALMIGSFIIALSGILPANKATAASDSMFRDRSSLIDIRENDIAKRLKRWTGKTATSKESQSISGPSLPLHYFDSVRPAGAPGE